MPTPLAGGQENSFNFDADAATRRAGFIGRSVEVRDQFSSASPAHVLKAMRILCCHGYGAVLWRLVSSSASSFFKAYNRCVKRVFRLPLNTFTYLVEGHHHSLQPGIPEKPEEPRLWRCLFDNDLGALWPLTHLKKPHSWCVQLLSKKYIFQNSLTSSFSLFMKIFKLRHST